MTGLHLRLQETQPVLLQRFQRMIQAGKMSHAYLFTGAAERLDMTLYLCQALFCDEPLQGLPCGQCRSCRLVESQTFPDIHLVEPVNRMIRTEQVRDILTQVSQSGIEGEAQVFVFEDAETMHLNGANALLKSMEEPTGRQYFFFLSQSSEKILPTIRSRSQYVYFPETGQHFQKELERTGLLKTQAQFLDHLLQGRKNLLDTIGQAWCLELERQVFTWLQRFLAGDIKSFVALSGLVSLADDKDKQGLLLDTIEILLGQEVPARKRLSLLEDLMEARRAWQANVPLLTSLERFSLKNL
ncbi:DNA polymerase III subunit delta' [Streptococcus sp. NLN64]|uniref:DNA polymerase III subunit delta' n=1 Tax=Streptococcus sp. NLN64 TaxID=2822799 RepID=UPI0018CBE3E8|nr:DNA polymerase III subunit delta' [Streptococcus sp. NLN64]MBG9367103.1 DNA polymerase III subunit delta' [Streptococcus sp. NLN64]